MTKKPVKRVQREIEQAWSQVRDNPTQVDASVLDAIWEQAGANQPMSSVADQLSDLHFADTSHLQEIIGLGQKGTSEYETAQKVLLERPTEHQPGHGAIRYTGANMPRFDGGK